MENQDKQGGFRVPDEFTKHIRSNKAIIGKPVRVTLQIRKMKWYKKLYYRIKRLFNKQSSKEPFDFHKGDVENG
jgi:hypothetical protein